MQWIVESGEKKLLLYPDYWPAGILITFDRPAAGDTLLGEARAMVADARGPRSVAVARVITSCGR